jgi:hypothetical protein
MAVEFGNLLAPLSIETTGKTPVGTYTAPVNNYRTAGYATIKGEKMPTVTDTVPTKDKNGKPLLAGYVTPENVWVA